MPFNGLKRGCCGLRMKFEAFEQIFSNDEYNSMVIFFCVFLLLDFVFNKPKKQAEKNCTLHFVNVIIMDGARCEWFLSGRTKPRPEVVER